MRSFFSYTGYKWHCNAGRLSSHGKCICWFVSSPMSFFAYSRCEPVVGKVYRLANNVIVLTGACSRGPNKTKAWSANRQGLTLSILLLQNPKRKVSYRGRRETGNVGESILDVECRFCRSCGCATSAEVTKPGWEVSSAKSSARQINRSFRYILFGYGFMHIIMPLAFSFKLSPV